MATVVDDQVAAQLNTRAASSVQNFGEAVARGILRQSDGADELARQSFIGLNLDGRMVTALNAREMVMAADPQTYADYGSSQALKSATPYWPQQASAGAPGGGQGAASGKAGGA